MSEKRGTKRKRKSELTELEIWHMHSRLNGCTGELFTHPQITVCNVKCEDKRSARERVAREEADCRWRDRWSIECTCDFNPQASFEFSGTTVSMSSTKQCGCIKWDMDDKPIEYLE